MHWSFIRPSLLVVFVGLCLCVRLVRIIFFAYLRVQKFALRIDFSIHSYHMCTAKYVDVDVLDISYVLYYTYFKYVHSS